MKERILEIIPDRNDIERTLKLAEEYGAVFEYNDFMVPRRQRMRISEERRWHFTAALGEIFHRIPCMERFSISRCTARIHGYAGFPERGSISLWRRRRSWA